MRFDVLESSLKITGLPIAGSRIPNNYTDGKNLKNKKNARWKQRRSVYLPVVRNNLYDVFSLFDYADASMINGNRPTTTIAPQALFLMNSDFVNKATQQMASGLLAGDATHAEAPADTARIQTLYLTAYGRPATLTELARAESFLDRTEDDFAALDSKRLSPQLRAWQLLCQIVVAADEFIYVR